MGIQYADQQVQQSSISMMKMFISQLDQQLSEAENYLMTIYLNESCFVEIQSLQQYVRQLAYIQLMQTLQKHIRLYPRINLLFLYNSFDGYTISVHGGDSQYEDRIAQQEYLLSVLQQDYQIPMSWFDAEVNGTHYLLRVMQRSGVYMGIWFRYDTLLISLNNMSTFVNEDGTVLVHQQIFGNQLSQDTLRLSIEHQAYKLLFLSAESINCYLCMAVPESDSLNTIPPAQWLTLCGSILSIAGVPLILWFIYHLVLRPLNILSGAIDQLRHGNIDYRIQEIGVPDEFEEVNQTFNSMCAEIQSLKIKAYEDEIDKQRLKLSYYQMQIKPHFFINALTTISNMERLGRTDDLQAFLFRLSTHVRFRMQPSFTTVTVQDELSFIENYILMQNMRQNVPYSYIIDCSSTAASVQIPPFVIYNFAENVVKHATRKHLAVTLFVHAMISVEDNAQRLHVTIEDNGEGINQQTFDMLACSCPDETGKHIGVWNTRQQLSLFYHDNFRLTFQRSDLGGLRVDLLLPTTAQEWEVH